MKGNYAKIGQIVCAVIAALGLLVFLGAIPGASVTDSGVNGETTERKSGYASFGSDYYTYSNNNMAMTAVNARATARNTNLMLANQRAICNAICSGAGILIMAVGAIGVCVFGILVNKENTIGLDNVYSKSTDEQPLNYNENPKPTNYPTQNIPTWKRIEMEKEAQANKQSQ
jgi:hypothetical protein